MAPFVVESSEFVDPPLILLAIATNARLKTNFQIYPRTIPPIRLGMKNPARKKFCPLMPLVTRYANANATILIRITENRE